MFIKFGLHRACGCLVKHGQLINDALKHFVVRLVVEPIGDIIDRFCGLLPCQQQLPHVWLDGDGMAKDAGQIAINPAAVGALALRQHMPGRMDISVLMILMEGERVEHRHPMPVAIAYAQQETAQVLA